MTITTRAGKGLSLTNTEMDSNLNSLDWRTAVIASSSVMSLTDEYNSFSVTGTTTITGLTKASAVSGHVVRFYFAGSSGTLTHGASLLLPGNESITWQVGDYAEFINVGAVGSWRCTNYTPKAISPHPKDEDDMISNSPTHLVTQQSVKTYVDERIVSLTNNNIVSFSINSLGSATGNPAGYSSAKIATGHFRITHPLGDTSYDVGVTVDGDGAEMTVNYLSKTSTTFDIYTWVNGVLTKPRTVDIYIRDRG